MNIIIIFKMFRLLMHRQSLSTMTNSISSMINEITAITSSIHFNSFNNNISINSANRMSPSLMNIPLRNFSNDNSIKNSSINKTEIPPIKLIKPNTEILIESNNSNNSMQKKIIKASNKSIFKFLYPYYRSPKIAKVFSISIFLTLISKLFATSVNISQYNITNSLHFI